MDKISLTFKLSTSLQKELLQQVIAEGYGMRGKSKWIIESIEQFLKLPNYPELVEIATDAEKLNSITSIRVPVELDRKIQDAVLAIRQFYPLIEGVRSNLIRASICQRLLRS